MRIKLAIGCVIVATALFVLGCSQETKEAQQKQKADIEMVQGDGESNFVQTGITKVYNSYGGDTYLVTLYDKKTGVEYILIRQSDMVTLQPRTAADGGVMLHQAEKKE